MNKTTTQHQTKPQKMWQVAAEAALTVKHETIKAGYKLNDAAVSKIAKVIRDNIYASNPDELKS